MASASSGAFAQMEIDVPAMAVALKKDMGSNKPYELFPNRVMVAGYNLGAYRTATAVGTARGLLGGGYNAKSKVELTAEGIDEALLTRIADAAYADLVAQLGAAGFEVVPLDQAMASPGAAKLKFGGVPYESTVPVENGKKRALIVGPGATGVRRNYPLAKLEIGSFGAPGLSSELQAMIVMPNVVLDFAQLKGSKFGNKATSEAELQFAIDPYHTRGRVMASTRSQFAEGDIIYVLADDVASDADFGAIGKSASRDNGLERGLGAALGMGVVAKSKKEATVQIDPQSYEKLARSAVRGWNAALVAQMKAAVGR
ncbi:hypothetical protein [Sphingosinicella rhizophila]|uniref:Uncharacterized protein n=1 Tax=Sphingosinicella rhizophila TaxID=3050082 RepID=A0ABU3Q7K4_9SPHN|nr:hypothetical protein [Sphingosinicella sp. GR2756]MDT9599384.1 hypothetical protein [Sphingosinicella sp. GR2756]